MARRIFYISANFNRLTCLAPLKLSLILQNRSGQAILLIVELCFCLQVKLRIQQNAQITQKSIYSPFPQFQNQKFYSSSSSKVSHRSRAQSFYLIIASISQYYKLSLVGKRLRMDFGIIQNLAKCIVRPPKASYSSSDLVPPCFQLKHRIYQHHEFTVLNNRGLKLKGSYIKDRYAPGARETIIFLHANGSCRIMIKNYLETFLPQFDFIAFDFAGCGLSEGQYITLGYNEKEDVYSIINYVRAEFGVKTIILWGRSMGGATSILYTAKYGGVKAIVVDNSYADLQMLITQLSDDYLPFLPTFLVDGIITSIQQYIEQVVWKKEMSDFNIRKLKPVKLIDKITCPVIFIGSTQDTFVNVKHTKELHAKAKTTKWLQLVKGNHNDPRPAELKEKILKYLIDIKDNKIQSAPRKSNTKERYGMFQEISIDSKTNSEKKSNSTQEINSPQQIKLVNCAELQFQKKSPLTVKFQEKVSKDLSSMDSQSSDKKSRESYLERRMKLQQLNKKPRSRSKLKRKKIFEGIEYINQHFNGQQN